MNKVPKQVTFLFDPDNSGIPALSDFRGRILWACIKAGHITSQHFNGNVQDVAIRLQEEEPREYKDFKNIIQSSGLNVFGTNCVRRGMEGYRELDDKYWTDMWDYLTKRKELKIIIKIKEPE